MSIPPTERYFSTYFEIVQKSRDSDGARTDEVNWSRRWQWIALPKAPSDKIFRVWSRMQTGPTNRAVWRCNSYADPAASIGADITQTLNSYPYTVAHTPIVIEISHAELMKSIGDPVHLVTPWPVINRVAACSLQYGYRV